MGWKPGESGNLSGRPPESVSVKRARKMLERGSPQMVTKLQAAIDKALAADDYKAAIAGIVAWLKKSVPDAQPHGAKGEQPEKLPTPEEVAEAVERLQLLREHSEH